MRGVGGYFLLASAPPLAGPGFAPESEPDGVAAPLASEPFAFAWFCWVELFDVASPPPVELESAAAAMEGTAARTTTAKSFAFIAPLRLRLKRSLAFGLTAIHHQRRPMGIDPGAERKSAGYADWRFRSQGAIRDAVRR